MSRRIVGLAALHAVGTANVLVTADEIADIAIESTCEITVLTTLRSCRSRAAPAYTLRAISSSVRRTFCPHFWIAAIAAVPVGRLAYGYSDPAPTASAVRSLTNGSVIS